MYKEIAIQLDVTIDAVKQHCTNIYAKLGVRNRTEAAIKYKDQLSEKTGNNPNQLFVTLFKACLLPFFK